MAAFYQEKHFLQNTMWMGIVFTGMLLLLSQDVKAQDQRAQLPEAVQQSYVELSLGNIHYPYTAAQLQPDYDLLGLSIPHTAVRLVLAGYQFNSHLSAQITYMRPVRFVEYTYRHRIHGYATSSTIHTNTGGITMKYRIFPDQHFSLYAEAGLGVLTRRGIFDEVSRQDVVKSATYASYLLGAGFQVHLDKSLGLQLCYNYSPAVASRQQPYTLFVGAGLSYYPQARSHHQMHRFAERKYQHPRQWLQAGITHRILGYGANYLVSQGPVPIFWGGDAQVRQGASLQYQRNIYHAARFFSMDWGMNASIWQSRVRKEWMYTFSIYPAFRFHFLRTQKLDAYFFYVVAGPTYISRRELDDYQIGEHFTFVDNMGIGIFTGPARRLNAELRIGHYSNGNLFDQNPGVMIPPSVNIGFVF